MPGFRPAGWPATKSTAPTLPCGPSWKPERSAMCWRWPATIVSTSTPAAPATALTPWSARSRRGPGSRCRAARAADPPPPAHQGAGLLPLLHAPTHPAFDPGQGGRDQVDHRGAVPDRQGAGRLGPASGPPLALLVPLGHPRHGRPRLPGGRRRDPAPRPPTTSRAGRGDLQRDPAPVRRRGRDPDRRRWKPIALVGMATATSVTRPHLPLPTTSHPATMNITIYGWSTRACFRSGGPLKDGVGMIGFDRPGAEMSASLCGNGEDPGTAIGPGPVAVTGLRRPGAGAAQRPPMR